MRMQDVDSRLVLGRRLLESPRLAEELGLDSFQVHLATLIKYALHEDLSRDGLDRELIELCLAAIAGGVSADALYARLSISFEDRAELLELADAAIVLVAETERRLSGPRLALAS